MYFSHGCGFGKQIAGKGPQAWTQEVYAAMHKCLPLLIAICFLISTPVSAQIMTEQQASNATYIKDLKLLNKITHHARLDNLEIHIAYVEKDSRLGGDKYFCGSMQKKEALLAEKQIYQALTKLPDTSLQITGLKYVIMCKCTLSEGQRIGGFPVPALGLLMVDVGESLHDPLYKQRTLLHEFYHLAEYRLDALDDVKWQRQFGDGYSNSYGELLSNPDVQTSNPGFLNKYSETFPYEERAELFANLILKPGVVIQQIKQRHDSVLKRKVQFLAEKSRQMMGISLPLVGL